MLTRFFRELRVMTHEVMTPDFWGEMGTIDK